MEKQTLGNLFSGKIFNIPDYQRGYAWKTNQLNDLIEDIDALVTDEKIKFHYTGTIVTFSPKDSECNYNRRVVKMVEVVDGQQRLTSILLYLSIILRTLVDKGAEEYKNDIAEFLFHNTTCRLTLNNETKELFYQLMESGDPRNELSTAHQKRLHAATEVFSKHILAQLNDESRGIEHLKKLFEAITGKLVFTYYTIEEECEIGMTFELMNSRGKGLSVLELLKNYFMHWVFRNEQDEEERNSLTNRINTAWRDIYKNIGKSEGEEQYEEQCLRVAYWILYCNHTPKNWKGYNGFKAKQYIPLRDFSQKNKEDVKNFLITFTDGLAEISNHYSRIVSPKSDNVMSTHELNWLINIRNTGNIANFFPLIIAARIHCENKRITEDEYINLLKSLECFIFRVFLNMGKRSNTGKSRFYFWGEYLFKNENQNNWVASELLVAIHGLIRHYSPEKDFIEKIQKPSNWYWYYHRALKYTLFEYEKHLLSESSGQPPRITWNDLKKRFND